MSMPHEPLTPEERALAQSLSRLGPHGGPSPELDARILGAARAAVQAAPARGGQVPPTRRRWPLGMGVAASVLLAAGVAWQLRPSHEIPVASEMPAASAPADASLQEAPAMAAEVADTAAPQTPPLAVIAEDVAPPAAAKILPPPPPARIATAPGPARKNAEAAARQDAIPKRSPFALLPAPASAPASEAPTREAGDAPRAFPADAASDSYAAPAAVAADVLGGAMREEEQLERAASAQQQEQRARYVEAQRDAAAKSEDSRTLDTIAVTGSRMRSRERQARTQEAAPVAAAPPPPPPPAASAGSTQPTAARNALRRTDLQAPVDQDTRLPPAEWLDRIRLRRDLGDDANALRSLQLFVQEHPFQRVPDDLRLLLGTP